MRQAGRYLPEFRKLKKKSNGFINMIYTPKTASDITLQPIKRFGFDAAIIFSDILVVPDSLGQRLSYEENRGPKLEKMSIDQMIKDLSIDKKNEKFSYRKCTKNEKFTILFDLEKILFDLTFFQINGLGRFFV